MVATKISMRIGCARSNDLLEISKIHITGYPLGDGWYAKEDLYNYLISNPKTITVDRYPQPFLIPAKSPYGERYVKSAPNALKYDNLLELPRE